MTVYYARKFCTWIAFVAMLGFTIWNCQNRWTWRGVYYALASIAIFNAVLIIIDTCKDK